MKIINIKAERNYKVEIGVTFSESIKQISASYNKVLLLAPAVILKQFKIKETKNLFILQTPNGENQKSINFLSQIWSKAALVGLKRSDAIIGFGGGATTDVAGFAAATWLRGINWYAIPTSLAGMVDAGVGGKTGINSPAGKNLIGSFYSPSKVLIDPTLLQTLPARDISAGMAEVIKCGFISDYKILNLAQEDVLDYQELIARAVKVKADVVSKDFKESKLREILNYGHTLGHAIEKHSAYKLRHGEAVAIGLVFAAQLANVKGVLSSEIVDLHRQILESMELPISYSRQYWSELYPLLALDKKSRGRSLRFVGITDIGNVVRIEDASESELATAYERISS